MKTVVATLCGLLLLAIMLPLAASLVVSIPAVQNAIVDRLARRISEKLGTKVSIDSVEIEFVNRVDVRGFYIEDFRGDTLLYVPRAVVPIVEWGLAGEPLTFGRVELTGARMQLHRDSTGMVNIREVVNAIRRGRPRNPDSKFRMHIEGIEADSLTFGLLMDDKPRREKGVDFSRFIIRNTKVDIDELHIVRDTVRIGIRALSFHERSGMKIDNISVNDLVVSQGVVALENVEIRSDETALEIPGIRLTGIPEESIGGGRSGNGDVDGSGGIGGAGFRSSRSWSAFRNFADSVAIEVRGRSTHLGADFLANFVPAVAEWNVILEDVEFRTDGPLAALSGTVGGRTLETELSLDFISRGLPDLEGAQFDIRVGSLATNASDVDSLVRSAGGGNIPEKLLKGLERLGTMGFAGDIIGKIAGFDAGGVLSTGAGDVNVAAKVGRNGERDGGRFPMDSRISVSGEFSVAGFDLGKTLAARDLGPVTGIFRVNGSMGGSGREGDGAERGISGYSDKDWDGAEGSRTNGGGMEGGVKGEISALEFKGYTYRDISLAGMVADEVSTGEMTARDKALNADIEVTFDRSGDVPGYRIYADLSRADLAATHLVGDSISLLSGRLAAEWSGRRLGDANGKAELSDVVYVSPRGSVSTPTITLSAVNSRSAKFFSLRSEFADADFAGSMGYGDMWNYPGGFLGRYIPRLDAESLRPAPLPPDGVDPTDRACYSIIGLHVKDTERLLRTLAPGAAVAPGSEARFMFNPYTGAFSLSATSEFIEYRGVLAEKVVLGAGNASDSLVVHLSSANVYTESMHLPEFVMHGGAKVRSRIDVVLDGKVWHIAADSLGYGGGRVAVDNLRVFSANDPVQRLSATGVVSRRAADTLHIGLDGFDLSPIGKLLWRGRLPLEGEATGRLDVARAAGSPKMDVRIELEGMSVAGTRVVPVRIESRPDSGAKATGFGITDRRTGDDIVRGVLTEDGAVSASVRADSIDMALLDPLLGGVLENTQGRAGVRLEVGGTLENLRIDGRIDIPLFETTVGYTKARYSIAGGEMKVENSRMEMPYTPLSDTYGGEGDIAITVDVSRPRDIAFDLDAQIRRLTALDTSREDNELFYGKLFATGSVEIHSDRMGTKMNLSARTNSGSSLSLPLNSGGDVAWADFVVFTDSLGVAPATDLLSLKRQAYRRRLAGERTAARHRPFELDLTVRATPDAEVRLLVDPALGDGITALGEGVLNLEVNPANNLFTMTGDYVIQSGRFDLSMMNVFNKNFVIAPGSTLQWTGSPTDALLGVDASYRVRTSLLPLVGEGGVLAGRAAIPVDCILRLGGRLSDPDITFDIALPQADPDTRLIVAGAMNTQELKSMQFLSLLTTGSFASDNSITGQSANSGAMATGAVGFDILTNQLSNFLSSEDYDLYFKYRPHDNFMSNQFDVGFSTGFADDRLTLEIEGNYVDDREMTSMGTAGTSALAGDVSLTWAIDKAGNLRLKVFSQTIDRMNETQGLQESGLGIYYKKDFDRLSDIFGRKGPKIKR